MRVLIAGCGFAGTAIAERFAAAGHDVWGLRRRPGNLPNGITPLAADLTDAVTLHDLPENLDVAVYSAAPDASDAAAYARTYVGGLNNLIRALEPASRRLRRLLLTSSTGVYGQTDGRWVDEVTPPAPTTEKGKILLQAESLLLQSPWPATAIRLGGIYGPGRRRLIDNVRTGRAECVDGVVRYSNRIHRDDIASAVYHLANLDDAAGLYVGVDCLPAEQCEVLRWLAVQLGVDPPRARAATPADTGESNKRCSNRRLLSTGYAFRFPSYREGYADVLKASA